MSHKFGRLQVIKVARADVIQEEANERKSIQNRGLIQNTTILTEASQGEDTTLQVSDMSKRTKEAR